LKVRDERIELEPTWFRSLGFHRFSPIGRRGHVVEILVPKIALSMRARIFLSRGNIKVP
jgi:hypothetical protein